MFTRSLADHDVVEGYDFREGMLVRGRYVFLQRPVNGLNEFHDYYAAVKESLTAVYGTPLDESDNLGKRSISTAPRLLGHRGTDRPLTVCGDLENAARHYVMELTGNHHSRLTIEYRSNDFAEPLQTA